MPKTALFVCLNDSHGPTTLVAWVAISSVILTAIPAAFVWDWPDAAGWAWLVALGCVTAGAHQCLVRSLAAADASAVMPYDYTRLLFTAALGWYAFGEVPALTLWIGAGITFAVTIYKARSESRAASARNRHCGARTEPVCPVWCGGSGRSGFRRGLKPLTVCKSYLSQSCCGA